MTKDDEIKTLRELLTRVINDYDKTMSQMGFPRGETAAMYPLPPSADNDGWIEWEGGECPVGGAITVDVKYRDTDSERAPASCFTWTHDSSLCDIVAYRVIENDGREG